MHEKYGSAVSVSDVRIGSRQLLPRGFGASVLSFWFLMLCVALAWSAVDSYGQFFLFGSAACFAASLPLLRRDYMVWGPWSLILIVVYVGAGVRGLVIALRIDGSRTLDGLFLLGQRPDYFFWPSLLYVVAIALMAIVYASSRRRQEIAVMSRLRSIPASRMLGFVIAGMAVIGFIGFALYAMRTGGLNPSALTAKRTTIAGPSLDESYRSHGELRLIASFSAAALWLQVMVMSTRSWTPGSKLYVFVLLLNAAALPFYSSARTEVVFICFVAIAIYHGSRGTLPKIRSLVSVGLAVLIVVGFMTIARSEARSSVESSSGERIVQAVGNIFAYNRNFGDMQTTTHIVRAIPDRLSYEYGGTIVAWAVAPVPRALWPGKPVVKSGPEIGRVVYGNARSGVPPGFVAEMYWNGDVPAVLLGSVLLGFGLRWIRDRVAIGMRGNPLGAFLYGAIFFRLGVNILNGGVGSGLFNAFQAGIVAGTALLAVLAFQGGNARLAVKR